MTPELSDKIKRLASACRINGRVMPQDLTLTVPQIFELARIADEQHAPNSDFFTKLANSGVRDAPRVCRGCGRPLVPGMADTCPPENWNNCPRVR